MPDSPQPGLPSEALAKEGDRYILGTAITVVDRVEADLVHWHIDRGTAKPLGFTAPPAEFARRMQKTLASGATFSPAP